MPTVRLKLLMQRGDDERRGVPPGPLPLLLLPLPLRRIAAVLFLTGLTLVSAAGPASAHADLVRSDPAAGSVLEAEPARVVLIFSEQVTTRLGTSVRVIGPDGRQLATTQPGQGASSQYSAVSSGKDAETDTLTVPLAPDVAQGTFAVVWHAVAADDGHATEGVVMFAVGHRSALPATAAGAESGSSGPHRALSAILNAATWLSFLGFALIIGPFTLRLTGLFSAATPPRTTAPAPAGWLLLAVATLVQFLSYGPYASGGSWRQLLDRTLIADTLGTRTGHALAARAALLVLLAIMGDWLLLPTAAARTRPETDDGESVSAAPAAITAPVIGVAAAIGLALTWSATSHAADGSHGAVAIMVTTLHVLAMGVWLGGLISLLIALRAEPGGRIAPLARAFSSVATGAVISLAASGAYQAWREIGGFSTLISSAYGRLLVLKGGLLVLILIVAARSRAIARADADAVQAPGPTTILRRTVLVEGVGVAAILLLTTMLIGTAPPR